MKQHEILAQMCKKTSEIVNELHRDGLAEFLKFTAPPNNPDFNVLASVNARGHKPVLLIVSGIPEEAGVWSYTLLQQGRVQETSMRDYFEMTKKLDWSMIVLNPHANGSEGGREQYHIQLDSVLHGLHRDFPSRIITLLCFSAGGSVVPEFLNQQPQMAAMINNIILIDTTPPPMKKSSITGPLHQLLEQTVLYGREDSDGKLNPWASASGLVLGLQAISVRAELHGEMPHKVIDKVEQHLLAVQ